MVMYFPLVATPVMIVFSLFNWTTPVGIEWLLLIAVGILTQFAQVYMDYVNVKIEDCTSATLLGKAVGYGVHQS